MGKRRKARECALQALFQLEFNLADPEAVIRRYWDGQKVAEDVREYGLRIVEGIRTHSREVDAAIQAASENWRIPRMAVVDRNILRIAVYELLFENTLVPAVVINEAIEVAKKYAGEEASVFINGILDAVRKSLEAGNDSSKEGADGKKRRIAKTGEKPIGNRN
jgi:transcription antitermination protein NusB